MKTYFGFAIADSMFPVECTIHRKEIGLEAVHLLLEEGVTSCLNPSHRATIDAMRERYGIDVETPMFPPRVELGRGDRLVVMSVRGLPRLTDRHEYTPAEIAGAEFKFSLYEVE